MKFTEASELSRMLAQELPDAPPDGEVRIDSYHRTFIQFKNDFVFPSIDLTGIRFAEAMQILELCLKFMPSYVVGCEALAIPRPKKDATGVHLVHPYETPHGQFLYMIRITGDYQGGTSGANMIEPARQGRTPSYRTNRLYYAVRIFPVQEIIRKKGSITGFRAKELEEAIIEISKDGGTGDMQKRERLTAILFDDVDYSFLDKRFAEIFAHEKKWESRMLRPFIVDYLTLCLNLPTPYRSLRELCVKYYARSLDRFLKHGNMDGRDPEECEFWNGYFAAWECEFSASPSGGPQWVLSHCPDIQWVNSFR